MISSHYNQQRFQRAGITRVKDLRSGNNWKTARELCAETGVQSARLMQGLLGEHIGLPMFSPSRRPKRIYQMSHGVLNLPRNPLLDWTFGHSLINCHVEHHLFPSLSDNMCLKVKPIVSRFLKAKALPYQEDGYLSRLCLFFHRYQELMVFAPPITELVGVQ
ncbi:hypothetical protein QTP70_031143 [Hemibagrus guttatus]|uniref:Fatty acid desaturase domain-containing protein n=1 Tax=Hemibagrus guttatus TaxID=175788 RepID=A0AAE0QQH0_9TELE|nr:hypothetical protein QTP70_031143 [Hemibagrus guttatus]KAK3559937.1 hypothetical protein QTP86_028849 [Hemibagrus guttatus]